MKHIVSVLVISLLNITSVLAQVKLAGVVLEQGTNEPVSFATVALKNANTGMNTDDDGKFNMTSATGNDTLIAMCVGYKLCKVALSAIATPGQVQLFLTPNDALEEVHVVTNKVFQKEELNTFKPDKVHRYINTNGYEMQIAQYFEAPKNGSLLESVTISLSDDPTMPTRFRIRVYAATANGSPGADLYPKEIMVNPTGKDLLKIDLNAYSIRLPETGFFVAVEWLKIADNAKSSGSEVYRPTVGFSHKGSKRDNVWRLNYRNEWYQEKYSVSKGNLAMTANVKY